MVSKLTFKSLIHFEFLYTELKRMLQFHFFYMQLLSFLSTLIEETVFSPLSILLLLSLIN